MQHYKHILVYVGAVTMVLMVHTHDSNNLWQSHLQHYAPLMHDEVYNLLARQCEMYSAGTAPTIAHDVIRSIPLLENGQGLIDLHTVHNPRIRAMQESELILAHERPEDIDLRAESFACMRQGVYDALQVMVYELDRLSPSFGYAVGELEVVLFEGLRDVATQKILFDTKMAELQERFPELTQQEAYEQTCTWVSPYRDNVPTHSTGAAVDIALWSNKKQAFCHMGRFNVGGAEAPTFTEYAELSDEQVRNRLLFLIAATSAGLINYSYEFWHYSVGDRYAVYWLQAHEGRHACYGSL